MDEDENYFRLRLEASTKNGLLKEARLKLNLTQKQVADYIGMHVSLYSQIERMQRYPIQEVRQKICDFYTYSGIPMKEEQVFPEQLKNIKFQRVYVASKDITTPQLESMVEEHKLLAESIEAKIEKEDLELAVNLALSKLNDQQSNVLKMYFGLKPYDREYTSEEIAKEMKRTRARILQIKDKALKNLRRNKNAKNLKIYLG